MERPDGCFHPTQISFTAFRTLINAAALEGLVIFDVGGDLDGWVTGITRALCSGGITTTDDPESIWAGLFELVREDGRHDLVLVFPDRQPADVDLELLEQWRKDKPRNAWVTDYLILDAPRFTRHEE